jgi:carbonic anhydrase
MMLRNIRVIAITGALVLTAATVSASATPRAAAPVASGAFTYNGDTGPGFWGDLSPDSSLCSTGISQSPINISNVRTDPHLRPLKLALAETPISLVNNGHAIEMEVESTNTLTLNGVLYKLAQFHFHTLSEHAINGERGAMEVHAVFKDATGRIVVVGMLYTIGRANAFLAELAANGLPVHTGDTVKSANEINLADGLTDTSAYYTYSGSLTTPPCTEGVTWFVLKHEAQMSSSQFRTFENILGNDFRPLQNLNGRTVQATTDNGDHGDR